MNHGNGVSRGDRNRNARLAKLRAAVPVTNAIVGLDLADRKQMVVVTDHDSKGAGAPHVSVQGLGSRCRAGLGCRAQRPGRLRGGHGGLRTHRPPVASAGPTGHRAGHVVRVRAAGADLRGPQE
jgi:hypothetical protein